VVVAEPKVEPIDCHFSHLRKKHKTSTRGVSYCDLAIYIKKYLFKAKEELWKLKYFTMQKYNLSKNPSTRNQNPSRY